MKKKLATVTLLLSTALAAAGCDSKGVTYKKDDNGASIVLSIKNGSDTINYTADDLLKDLQDSSSAKSTLYSEVSRQVFTKYAEDTLDANKKNSIREDAVDKVTDFKADCETNAKTDGTDYDDYVGTALENLGVENFDELESLYYYQGLKEELLDGFVEKTEHYNYFLDKYLECYTPYQVKHILVAANTNDTKYIDGTMTNDNARKLLTVMDRFLAGDKFGDIAEITDDTSSAQNGGIMPFNQAQNYVSEFRFATYVQEIFGGEAKSVEDRYNIASDLHIIDKEDTTQEEFENSNLYDIYGNGIGSVKMADILALKGDVTKEMAGAYNYYDYSQAGSPAKGNDIPTIAEQTYEMNVSKFNDEGDLNVKYYEEYELERNQIFNRTLNSHKVQYIDLEGYTTDNSTTIKVYDPATNALVEKTVLADGKNGNPVFVAIASTGIHFMSMVWNAYNPRSVQLSDEALTSLASLAGTTKDAITDLQLNQAYFTLFNSDDTDMSKYQYTYIGQNTNLTKSEISSNSKSLLNAISGYASNLEYYLFDALVYGNHQALVKDNASFEVSFYDDELADIMKDYVQDRLTSTDDSFASSVASAADTYAAKLAREAEVKQAAEQWKFVYKGTIN